MKDRFADLLFPKTIEWKDKQLSKTEQGTLPKDKGKKN